MKAPLTRLLMIRRSGMALAALAAGMAALPVAASAQMSPAGASPVQQRASELRLGVYDPHGTMGDAPNVGMEHVFMPWTEVNWATLKTADQYAVDRRRELLISVEPWSWSGNNPLKGDDEVTAILNGKFDSTIETLCTTVNGLQSPTTIRFAHEMDDTSARYSWSGLRPARYISAYRYFVTACRKAAPNARFMWSPRGEATLASFYPGSQYVDSVGISVFGLQAYDREHFGRDRTFGEVMGERYGRVAGFGKPVVAAELGFSGDAAYMDSWADDIKCSDPRLPLLRSVVYFDEVDPHAWPDRYGRPDWRLKADLLKRGCHRKVAEVAPAVVAAPAIVKAAFVPRSKTPPAAPAPVKVSVTQSGMQPAKPALTGTNAGGATMSARELARLYGGKSWMWSDGAGYFAPNHQFTAWSGVGPAATYGLGRWDATDTGQICFKAVWHSATGASRATTCFSHRKEGSTISQKREPSGEWYVFAQAQDPASKLKAGDLVGPKLAEIKSQLKGKY